MVHSESNNSLNVCSVVEDEMDEEDIDDTEEQSEEIRAVRVGQKEDDDTDIWPNGRNMNEHTSFIEAGAHTVSLHGQAILLIEAESLQRRSKMTKT